MTKKILIIDDEEDVRTYLNSLLTNNGYHTKVAENGEDGFRKLTEFLPDLIILDIIMPNQSGVGFYRKLKKSEVHKDIPQLPNIKTSSPMTIRVHLVLKSFLRNPFPLKSF
jgi:CheY-like chemotaxis protein